MPLLDAPTDKPASARRRNLKRAVACAAGVILAALAWMYRNWPEERSVDKVFAALQHQDYETAYGIYFSDPAWLQDQNKYSQDTSTDFDLDWVPEVARDLITSPTTYQ